MVERMNGIMVEVIVKFTGEPTNLLEAMVLDLSAIALSLIFIYLILWMIIRVGEWIAKSNY